MGRLALLPRYREVEMLVGGGFEAWTNPALPDGWTLVGGGNGTVARDTVEPFAEAASARIDKTAAGTIYFVQPPRANLIPGMYYRIQAARRPTLSGANPAACRFVNVTRSQCLNTSGVWISGTTSNWTAPPAGKWFLQWKWFQIPGIFSDSDIYEYRAGNFFSAISGTSWFDSCSQIGPYVRPIHMVGLAGLTYAALARKEIVVTLTGPSGVEIDITRRVKLDGLGTITEGAEEEILRLTHGDMTLTLDDRDGMLRGLFQDATATDHWELVVLAETGRAHGLKWDRLFAGVLDLPWSVSFNPREKETTIQVFSYTKALDNISATGVGRVVTGRTFTIAASSKNATTNDTADLLRGDQITARVSVAGVSTQETFTVDRIDSATAFRVKDAAQNAFTSADLSLDSYFHREKTATFLAGAVCDAASVQNREINLGGEIATFPLAQPIAAHGVGLSSIPMSLVPQAGSLVATFVAADETKRRQTTGPTAPWADGATSNSAQIDWTPYLRSAPGTIQLTVTPTARPDVGENAADHANQYVYYPDSGALLKMNLFRSLNGAAAVDLGQISALNYSAMANQEVEFDSSTGRVFTSFRKGTIGGSREIDYWDGSRHTWTNTISGSLRSILYGASSLLVIVDHETNEIHLTDPAASTFSPLRTIPWPTTDLVMTWTMRTWGTGAQRWFTFLFQRNGETWVAVFNALSTYSSWFLAASYLVSTAVPPRFGPTHHPQAFQTLTTLANGRQVAIGYAAGEWFVLSTRLDGVVPYADFTGLSCAGALKELSVASIAYLDTDRYNTVTMIQRPGFLAAPPVQTIDDALERTSIPIWEFYRTAVKITGKDALGASFEVIQGLPGGSAKMFELSSPLISTAGMALAISLLYFAYLNRNVRQENIRIDEPEERVRVLDVVNFDDAKWLATDVRSNTRDREQTLRLFEVR